MSRYHPVVDILGWEERYRTKDFSNTDLSSPPTQLVVDTAAGLQPGSALDLACGTGRNALWLAEHGWHVGAIDGSPTAIEKLRERTKLKGLGIDAQVADLQNPSFALPESHWDLLIICYYLQRDLLARAKAAVKPGGVLLVIAHTVEGTEQPTESRLLHGELRSFFLDWRILHDYEGKPNDPAHQRAVAEIVARRP